MVFLPAIHLQTLYTLQLEALSLCTTFVSYEVLSAAHMPVPFFPGAYLFGPSKFERGSSLPHCSNNESEEYGSINETPALQQQVRPTCQLKSTVYTQLPRLQVIQHA